jgi:hypothetical protein
MILAAGTLAAALVMLAFTVEHRAIIEIIRQTVYPGQRRIEAGGTLTPLHLISGFYDVFLLRDRWAPALGANQSEQASFFMLSLVLLPLFVLELLAESTSRRRIDLTLLAAVGFSVLMFLWMLVGLPAFWARLLMFQFVPPARAWLGLGMANFFLVYYYLFRIDPLKGTALRIGAWVASLAVFIAVWCAGVTLAADAPDFIRNVLEIALISAASALLTLLLVLRKKYAFSALMLFFSLISTLRVNPVYVGLAPVLGSDLSRAIQRVDEQDGGDPVWMVYDHRLGNYLAANGARVFGGTHAYQDLQFWKQFDPDSRYLNVYNRYSHVLFARPSQMNRTEFELLTADAFEVRIDPCDPRLAQLGVRYYLFVGPAMESCLRLKEQIHLPNVQFYLYERLQQPPGLLPN